MTDFVQFVRDEVEEALLRNCTFACLPLEKLSEIADHIEKLEAGEIEFDRVIGNYASENALFRDRIEKLEAALRELSTDWPCCDVSKAMRDIARKVLEGKDD